MEKPLSWKAVPALRNQTGVLLEGGALSSQGIQARCGVRLAMFLSFYG